MNQQQRFEAFYAKQHDIDPEDVAGYRMGDSYRLPGIAAHYRTFKAAEDGRDIAHDRAYRNGMQRGFTLGINGEEAQYGKEFAEYQKGIVAASLEAKAAKPQGEPTAEQLEAGCQAYMEADGNSIMHLSSMGHAYKAMRALEPGCQHDWCPSAISSTPDYCTRCGEDKPEQEATDARNAEG